MNACFILGSKEVFKNSKTDMPLQFRMMIIYDLRLHMISHEMMGLALQLLLSLGQKIENICLRFHLEEGALQRG